MAKKAAIKKKSNKASKPVKKPAVKKNPEATPPVDELTAAKATIAQLQKEVETLKAAPTAEVEKPAKPPGCTLSFPRRR